MLTNTLNRYKLSASLQGGVCMKGSIGYDAKSKRYAVDHRNISSTRQYAKVEVSRRLEILEKKVVQIGRKDKNVQTR